MKLTISVAAAQAEAAMLAASSDPKVRQYASALSGEADAAAAAGESEFDLGEPATATYEAARAALAADLKSQG